MDRLPPRPPAHLPPSPPAQPHAFLIRHFRMPAGDLPALPPPPPPLPQAAAGQTPAGMAHPRMRPQPQLPPAPEPGQGRKRGRETEWGAEPARPAQRPRLLHDYRTDPNRMDNVGDSPLNLTVRAGSRELASDPPGSSDDPFLLSGQRYVCALYAAAAGECLARLGQLAQDASPELLDGALARAVVAGNAVNVQFLLERGGAPSRALLGQTDIDAVCADLMLEAATREDLPGNPYSLLDPGLLADFRGFMSRTVAILRDVPPGAGAREVELALRAAFTGMGLRGPVARLLAQWLDSAPGNWLGMAKDGMPPSAAQKEIYCGFMLTRFETIEIGPGQYYAESALREAFIGHLGSVIRSQASRLAQIGQSRLNEFAAALKQFPRLCVDWMGADYKVDQPRLEGWLTGQLGVPAGLAMRIAANWSEAVDAVKRKPVQGLRESMTVEELARLTRNHIMQSATESFARSMLSAPGAPVPAEAATTLMARATNEQKLQWYLAFVDRAVREACAAILKPKPVLRE